MMKDQFRSDLRIGKVKAPVLILHGERDTVIPIGSGERLYGLIKSPKRFARFHDGGHENLSRHGAITAAKAFLNERFE
jgi:dipeptidyl aminopeptidase/acylaminoacyl peptidase